jgi:hypothetical protein
VQAVGLVHGPGDEVEQARQEIAGQPGIGGVAGLVERHSRKPPGKGLRRDRAAVEVDVVGVPIQGLGFDRDGGGRLLGQRTGRAVHGNDAIPVAITRLHRVIGPLEGLERVFVAAGVLDSRGRPDAGERLVPAQPDGLALGEIGPLDGKPHQPIGVGLFHVEG